MGLDDLDDMDLGPRNSPPLSYFRDLTGWGRDDEQGSAHIKGFRLKPRKRLASRFVTGISAFTHQSGKTKLSRRSMSTTPAASCKSTQK